MSRTEPAATVEVSDYDVLPVGIVVVDKDLRVASWNATIAKWASLPAHEAIGRTLAELFDGFDPTRLTKRLESVFADGQSVVLSAAMHRHALPLEGADGRPLIHRIHASATADDPSRARLVIEDVTAAVTQLDELREERRRLRDSERSLRLQQNELKKKNADIERAQRRAERASEAKSEFLANMSHEIRTPLTAIKGFAELLVDQAGTDFARDAANRVTRNAGHLLELVNGLLDLSRIEAGGVDLNPVGCSVREIAEDVRQSLDSAAKTKGVDLAVACADDVPEKVHVDPLRLRQVLLNLADNAVKFTDAGSVLIQIDRLSHADDANELRICVSDTGIGIRPESLEEIFSPFMQVDSTAQRRFGGAGLGLSICRQIVRRMGGRIVACSELGKGSVFTVILPAFTPMADGADGASDDAVQADCASDEGPSCSLEGLQLLVAEDGPDNQKLIEYLLAQAGGMVAMVENGQEAVDAALAAPEVYDVIVLDMQMPVLDGYAAAARLRAGGVAKPIVALTASAMPGDRERALRAGCDAYMAKPIDRTALLRLLRSLARQQIDAEVGV